MFSVVPAAVLVGLGPHREAAIRTPDESLQEVPSGGSRVQGLGPARVLPEHKLHRVEHLSTDQGVVEAWVDVFVMLDHARVKGVVEMTLMDAVVKSLGVAATYPAPPAALCMFQVRNPASLSREAS